MGDPACIRAEPKRLCREHHTVSLAPVIKREMGGERGGGRSRAQGGPAGADRSAGSPGPGKKHGEEGRAWEEQTQEQSRLIKADSRQSRSSYRLLPD